MKDIMVADDAQRSTPLNSCPMRSAGWQHDGFAHEGMYNFFAAVRAEVPLFFSEDIGYWVVTRRADVLAILRDPSRFSASIATEPFVPWPQAVLDHLREHHFTNEAVQVSCDPPKHTRIRAIAARFLNVRQFSRYEPDLRALVRSYCDTIDGKDEIELVDALLYEYPAQVVFLLLGERSFSARTIKKWGQVRSHMTFGRPSSEDFTNGASDLSEFWQYAVKLVEAREKTPADDYASYLLRARGGDDSVLTRNEIFSLVFGLLLAGHETTSNAAGNLMLELLRRPSVWNQLAERPELISGAVEEGLRFASPAVGWRRVTTQDVEVSGINLPAGSKILLSLASANHDEANFGTPDEFDVFRANSREHVSFGSGIHSCLGAPLARLELRIMVEELVARFPKMSLAPEQRPSYTRTIVARGPDVIWARPYGHPES